MTETETKPGVHYTRSADLPVTDRQREVYRWVFESTATHGYQPSYHEIAAHFGINSSNVHQILTRLRNKGYIAPATSTGNPGNTPRGGPGGRAGMSSRALRFLLTPSGENFLGFQHRTEPGTQESDP